MYSQHHHSHSQSGSYYGSQMNPNDPHYYPQRPNSYFGGSSQHSGVPYREGSGSGSYRDSHEMVPSPRGSRVPTSAAGAAAGGRKSAANQHAFGDDGSDSEESDDGQGFNVYNDFNNKGQRYSAAVSSADAYRDDPFGSHAAVNKSGYPHSPTNPQATDPLTKDPELVSMPNLGQDWGNEEARTDKQWEGKLGGKKKQWNEKKTKMTTDMGEGFHSWMRGERKVCGWLGWQQGVFLTFFFLVALGVTLYFVIPRVPSLLYNSMDLMDGNNNTIVFLRTPTNFSFDATMNLALDGRNSWIPVHAKDITVTVNDLGSTSGVVTVGEGKYSGLTTSRANYTLLPMPVHFSYSTSNTSDSLWNAWYAACAHIWPGNSTSRPTLNLGIVVEFSLDGVLGRKGDSTQVNDVACPIQLSSSNA